MAADPDGAEEGTGIGMGAAAAGQRRTYSCSIGLPEVRLTAPATSSLTRPLRSAQVIRLKIRTRRLLPAATAASVSFSSMRTIIARSASDRYAWIRASTRSSICLPLSWVIALSFFYFLTDPCNDFIYLVASVCFGQSLPPVFSRRAVWIELCKLDARRLGQPSDACFVIDQVSEQLPQIG